MGIYHIHTSDQREMPVYMMHNALAVVSAHICVVMSDTCISCNMGVRDLPDMYTRRLRAARPKS